jgi:hypothetical protein
MVIESPEEIERMRFSHVWLSSTLASTVGFTGLLDIRAVGYNAADDSVVIHDTVVVVPDKSGGRAVTMTTIDIAPLLNISPRRIVTAGRIGAVGAGSASGRDCFFGEFLLQAPLRACLLPDTFNFGPWPVPVDPARTPMLLDDVTDGEVVVRLVNHMPVAMAGELAVWSRQGETATVALGVSAPAVDRVTGRVVAASDTTICSPLPLAERAVFTDSFQAVIRLFLPATDTVTLAARDYVQVEHSYARLTFRREPE